MQVCDRQDTPHGHNSVVTTALPERVIRAVLYLVHKSTVLYQVHKRCEAKHPHAVTPATFACQSHALTLNEMVVGLATTEFARAA